MKQQALRLMIGVFLAFSIIVQLFINTPHGESLPWWHSVPGTYALFGFLSVVVLVGIAKTLSASGIETRKEDD